LVIFTVVPVFKGAAGLLPFARLRGIAGQKPGGKAEAMPHNLLTSV
jgi:hypothetical protein